MTMFMAFVFTLNQLLSHGFGLFLFAALVPMMRAEVGITYWQLALIGALTQIAYLAGALLLGSIGHRIGTVRLSITTGIITSILLFSLSVLDDPIFIIMALTLLAASASISWGTIVEIVSRHALKSQCSTYLTTISSGTAWGYVINGCVILFVVPLFGWQASWLIASLYGAFVVVLTLGMLMKLISSQAVNDMGEGIVLSQRALSSKQLLNTVIKHPVARFSCLVCLLVGFSTMPFANWLNTYLDGLGLASNLGGYTWTVAGVSGILSSFLIGKLADTKGHSYALLVIFGVFFVCLLTFLYDAAVFSPVAGFGYGLMYFPMWGVVAGWVGQSFGSTATMQINGICMVTFGLGGTVGNLVAGYIYDLTQSLELVYIIIAADAFLLVLLGCWIMWHQKHRLTLYRCGTELA